MRCAIWHHLHNFKKVKNVHEGVSLIVKVTLLKVTLLHGCFYVFKIVQMVPKCEKQHIQVTVTAEASLQLLIKNALEIKIGKGQTELNSNKLLLLLQMLWNSNATKSCMLNCAKSISFLSKYLVILSSLVTQSGDAVV